MERRPEKSTLSSIVTDYINSIPETTVQGKADSDDEVMRTTRRNLLFGGLAASAIGGIFIGASFESNQKSEYSFHLDGIPPSKYFTQEVIVDFQDVTFLDDSGRTIPLENIGTVSNVGIVPSFQYTVKRPLLTVNPLDSKEMMVKLEITMRKNPTKPQVGYFSYAELEEMNGDILYDDLYLQAISVDKNGQLVGLNNITLDNEEFNKIDLYFPPSPKLDK